MTHLRKQTLHRFQGTYNWLAKYVGIFHLVILQDRIGDAESMATD
jgi:hypothetical protein